MDKLYHHASRRQCECAPLVMMQHEHLADGEMPQYVV
jgi:hypothetical protein